MTELICLVLGCYIGYKFGIMYSEFKLVESIILESKDSKQDKEHTILIIEKNNDILYLYNQETENFICQGKTLDELAYSANKYNNIDKALVLNTASNNILVFANGKYYESKFKPLP